MRARSIITIDLGAATYLRYGQRHKVDISFSPAYGMRQNLYKIVNINFNFPLLKNAVTKKINNIYE